MLNTDRPTTLYFVRVHLKSEFPKNVDLFEKLEKLLERKNNYITDKKDAEFSWIFTDFEKLEKDIIYCALAKMETKDVIKTYEDGKLVDKKNNILKRAIEYSNFWIIPKENLIVFERRRDIGEMQFLEILSKSFKEMFYEDKLRLDFDFLKNPKEIFKLIETADKFVRFKLNVHPTNPDNHEDLKKIDDELKALNAKGGLIEFYNPNGLDLKKKGTLARSGIILASRGYGEYLGEYYIDDEQYNINSNKPIMKEHTKLSSNKKDVIDRILKIAEKALECVKDDK